MWLPRAQQEWEVWDQDGDVIWQVINLVRSEFWLLVRSWHHSLGASLSSVFSWWSLWYPEVYTALAAAAGLCLQGHREVGAGEWGDSPVRTL